MRVLLVEDSSRLRRTLAAALRRSGYAVDLAADGGAGLELAEAGEYDVIVLDLMLPVIDGLTVLRRLRESRRPVRVLILTARDTVRERVQGLDAGADDYLIKPFALEELLARVQALCRRHYDVGQPRVIIGQLVIDMRAKIVTHGGAAVPLKPREFALLEYLAVRRGDVVSRTEIERHIYDEHLDPMSNVVDSAISILRKRLSQAGAPPLIHTRHGLGYCLDLRPV